MMSARHTHSVPGLLPFPQRNEMARLDAQISYILMCVSLLISPLGLVSPWFWSLCALFWVCGGVWTLMKKPEAYQTVIEDHYTNVINVFQVSVLLIGGGALLVWALEAWHLLFFSWLWLMFRLGVGVFKLTLFKPYYSPESY
ncbi:hypothetical protein [Ferrimonas sp. SCSIO 43195]|uniref:hypothetical protein n=1 Tax=Ferrimonas sp. SCSIO 43195 TaxID=2822844 RepID=UPI0020762010|nr:hypothetical protein [Ferrimonas sp. SCSIO 43195]USD39035.1 hypothetical protein J8Z22_08005 [Ferrimonas sp. SCSIO 43195]